MGEQAWPDLYRDYLRSQEWALKRAKVMRRANHRCEGCGNHQATEVHHLTYAHVTQEFLFELVALCAGCHQRIHSERGEPKRPEVPKWTNRSTAPKGETEFARSNRLLLEEKAAEARKKFMDGFDPKPLPDAVAE